MRRRKHPPAAPWAASVATGRPQGRRPSPPAGQGASEPTARPPAPAQTSPARRPRRPAGDAGFWLWGRHAVLAAVANPRRRLLRLAATDETAAELAAAVSAAGCPRPAVERLDRRMSAAPLPADAVHQGFAAFARPLPPVELGELPSAAPGLLLVVLDRVTDPRNVGAVLRSAHAFGAAAVIVQDRHAPDESGALAKAASGALEAVPLVRVTNISRTLRALREDGIRCIGLAAEATEVLDRTMLGGPVALVLGAEGEGLRRLVRETCDALVRIPIAPGVDSLNLSAAAAVALHECARARTADLAAAPAAAGG